MNKKLFYGILLAAFVFMSMYHGAQAYSGGDRIMEARQIKALERIATALEKIEANGMK